MKIRVVIVFLLFSMNAAWAQQLESLGNVNLNALDYLLQERYVPERRVFDPKDKKGRIHFSMFGGITQLVLGPPASPGSIDFGGAISWDWAPLHALRSSIIYSNANRGYDEGFGNQRRYGIECDDMFSLLDFLQGYKKNRWTDLKTTVGFGVYYSDPEYRSSGKFAIGAHAGLHLSHAIYDHIAFFLEPRAHLFSDTYDVLNGLQSARDYHTGFQFLIGATYNFSNFVLPSFITKDMYFEYFTGIHGDYSDRVDSYFDEKSGRLGPSLGLGIGKWYRPLGYRASIFTGYHSVPMEVNEGKGTNYLVGLRAEGMINFNKLFCQRVLAPKLEINGGIGYEGEAVFHDKEKVLKNSVVFAHGPTFSMQLLYRLNATHGLFIQSRYSDLKYSEKFKDERTESRKKQIWGLEVGLQYRRNRREAFKCNRLFKPYNFLELFGGANATIDSKKSSSLGEMLKTDLYGAQAGFRLGRRFSPYSAIRANIETGFMNIGSKEKAFPLTISAEYMVDFTTLFTRYRANRFFTFSPFVGIAYAHHNNGQAKWDTRIHTVSGSYWGLSIGLNEFFRFSDRYGLFLEQNLRMYKGTYNAGANTYTSLKLSNVLSFNVGMRYKL